MKRWRWISRASEVALTDERISDGVAIPGWYKTFGSPTGYLDIIQPQRAGEGTGYGNASGDVTLLCLEVKT